MTLIKLACTYPFKVCTVTVLYIHTYIHIVKVCILRVAQIWKQASAQADLSNFGCGVLVVRLMMELLINDENHPLLLYVYVVAYGTNINDL